MSALVGGRGARSATEPSRDLAIQTETGATETRGCVVEKGARGAEEDPPGPSSLAALPCLQRKPGGCLNAGGERAMTRPGVPEEKGTKTTPADEELRRSDHCLSGGSESDYYESDDDVSLVLSDDCIPCVTDDESHYITTHEIQLSETSDHEGDGDLGVGSSAGWDVEEDNRAYPFADYASVDGGGAAGERAAGRRPPSGGAAAVSAPLESDRCDAAEFPSSDGCASKLQQQQQRVEEEEGEEEEEDNGHSAGQIHLSIRTTSRAINDPGNVQVHETLLNHARPSGEASRCVFRGVDGKAETPRDRAKCFIAAPRRLHFGCKPSGKEVTGYSSGGSSAVSELDDADKEVRNLTARTFKSLAYPYLDAIHFSTSSESSASEHGRGVNRWSTFVDLKCGKVNASQGLHQSVVSHQNSTASFEIGKNTDSRGCKGVALASIKPPASKVFALNGAAHGASSSTKKIELTGKFGQSHGGVITLTETLNFRCNVNSGMSEGERRTNFAQNAAGSRSTDEVTGGARGGQSREASKPPSSAMEDTHKKAIFASSLIKNVISKKMQFEQERKMERGEIREPRPAPSPCVAHQESDSHRGRAGREMHRQSSRFSESGSDHAATCADELADVADSGSCDAAKSEPRRQEAAAPAPETTGEPASDAGFDTKKGRLEASKSTLLRSQNSAFRCWKDEELEFQKDHKNDKPPPEEERSPSANDEEGEWDLYSSDGGNLTQMSHLFVPSIQRPSSDGEAGRQPRDGDYSPRGNGGGIRLRVEDAGRAPTSKSPEIKINLRSVRDDKTEPFGASKLRDPNIGCSTAGLLRTDDFKCQALAAALKGESADKVPHFMVRDIRDNKGKLQTPIHQVRDVRKLVKSSYHFVSLDSNDTKSNVAPADGHSEQKMQMPHRNPNSVSPIVIKCQSVNTNSNGKQAGNLNELSKWEPFDTDRSSPEGAKGAALQKAAGRAPTGNPNNSSEGGVGSRTESGVASKRQDRVSDIADKKPESKTANLGALEKLQAAVKTMEQLYVFERNEWKRKNTPQPLTDSHVLSLIASEEHGGPEEEGARGSNTVRRDSYPNADKIPPALAASPGTDSPLRREDKVFQTPGGRDDRLVAKPGQTSGATGSKNAFSFKASAPAKMPQPNAVPQTPYGTKIFAPKSTKLPLSLKISQTQLSGHEGAEPREVERAMQEPGGASADNENYLTIPVKSHASGNRQASSADKTSVYTFSTQTHPTTPLGHLGSGARGLEDHNQSPKRRSIVMDTYSPEIPSATVYHSLPLGMPTNQPQVYCFSPAITPAPTLDPFQATQRKMLLDPTTGNYYLVDTPMQPATKRLFDPETGQYVDVPMPQPPMTPVPVPISPLALGSAAYGHAYMIYPGFMPTPAVIPARTLVQSQMSAQSEAGSAERAAAQQPEGMYVESPFYMTTGKSPQEASGAQQQATASRPLQGFTSVKQPAISITSQQGPRIIAPPSFDGTTMSFVVEHR